MRRVKWLPRGSPVSDDSWRARHRIVQGALWLSVLALLVLGVLGPMPRWEGIVLPAAVAGLGLAGALVASQAARADLTSLGLIGASFAGVELSGGQEDAHLFILSAVALVSLYQRWGPLLYTTGAVLVHHVSLAIVAPGRVFTMSMPTDGHDLAAGVHLSTTQLAVMVVAHTSAVAIEVVAILLFWHFSELLSTELHQSLATLTAREEQLHHQATHDILTGLPNRGMFADQVGLRLDDPAPFAILLLDIDDFKHINDTFGHPAGDALLESLSARMNGALRESDLLARLSGDEFAVLLRSVTDLSDAQAIADRLLEAVAAPFDFGSGPVAVSISIGIARTDDTLTLQDLLRHADSAMYRAKRGGKARSAAHDSGDHPSEPRALTPQP